MKILVHFDPGTNKDIFQATRLRKNIKGGLELNNVTWVNSIYDSPDVAHLMCPADESLAKEIKEEGIQLVVSALYSEGDPSASFTVKNFSNELSLTNKAKKILEHADAILVPSEEAKRFLLKFFEDKRIEVVSPGVNRMRFEIVDPLCEKAFYRYARFSDNEKYFITIGEYSDKDTLTSLRLLAMMMPQYHFFFIGGDYGEKSSSLKTMNRKNPSNLVCLPLLTDDLYISALKNAYGFIRFDSMSFSTIVTLEALASKTPVFSIGDNAGDGDISKAFISYKNLEEMFNLLPFVSPSQREEAIMCGYQIAKEHSLAKLGSDLKRIYDSLTRRIYND